MFGIGLSEFVVILVVGLVAFGPDKLPELARHAARAVRQVRRLSESARDELRAELGPDYSGLELRDLDPRLMVRRYLDEALDSQSAGSTAGAAPELFGASEVTSSNSEEC